MPQALPRLPASLMNTCMANLGKLDWQAGMAFSAHGVKVGVRATDPSRVRFDGNIDVPLGGWVAARTTGPKSKYLGDDYAFAQTSPVYVVRGGKRFVKAADVQFLSDTCEAVWTRVQGARWRSDSERAAFRAAIDKAKAYYAALAR